MEEKFTIPAPQTSNVIEKETPPSQTKPKKKTFVVLAIGCAVVFLIIALVSASALVLILNKNDEKGKIITDPTPVPTEITEPTATVIPDDIVLKPNTLVIDYLPEPQVVSGEKLYTTAVLNCEGEVVEYTLYKVGTVKSWTDPADTNKLDLTGSTVYIEIDKSGPNYDMIRYYPFVRFVVKGSGSDEQIYIYDKGYEPYDMCLKFKDNVTDISTKVDLSNYYFINSYATETNSKNNVVSFKSSNNNYYGYTEFNKTLFTDLKSPISVDNIGQHKIYLLKDDKGANYIRALDGFTFKTTYMPSILKKIGYDLIPQITWNNNTTNNYVYDYVSIGGCFENDLEIENQNLADLVEVGKANNGSSIYELKDVNDTYRKKIYNEDYKAYLYDGNTITEDDTTPFTYEKYLSYHPVFYWKDPFDRYIKFANREFVMTGGCAKPAIYLYPETKTDISVKVIPNGELTFTSPQYNKGWDVTAYPNGQLINKSDGKTYDYLWWESKGASRPDISNGFIVERDNLEIFLNNTLDKYGLNQKESDDFINYWLPILQKNDSKKIFISFLIDKQVNNIASLEFSKTPDSEFRLFMVYRPANMLETVKEPEIIKFKRIGFTVVEWGGAEL